MSIQDISSAIGGLLLLFFAVWQIVEKVCSNMEWFKRIQQNKIEKEKKKQEELVKNTTETFVEKILPPVLEKIEQKDSQQDEKLNMLIRSSNDLLRKDIVKVYYKYMPYKKILQYDKEFVAVAYRDYHEQGGNSFIDGLMNELNKWPVVLTPEELK